MSTPPAVFTRLYLAMICLPSRSLERAKSDVRLWRVAIQHVLVHAKLYTEDELLQRRRRPYILAFSGGQNPVHLQEEYTTVYLTCKQVFWVDGKYVVKFFSYTYAGEEYFHRESDSLTFLENLKPPSEERLEIPRLVDKGFLYPKDHPLLQGHKPSAEHWRWPFVVQTFVKGQPICNLAPKMTREDKIKAARYLGKVLRTLHEADYSALSSFDKEDPWDYFRSFLYHQYKHVVENYRRARGMNEAILTAIPSYLPKHPEMLYLDQKDAPSLLHADMTDENLLGNLENGIWEPVGLLDFGDVRLGHRIYELMPIHIDVFKLDSSLTMEYLTAYGLEFYDRDTFIYKAMCFTILHSQDAFRSIFNHKPELFTIEDIHELARAIWELPWPMSADSRNI